MNEKIAIKTERLTLRQWLEKDLKPFAELNADPEVMEYFPSPLSTEKSNELIQKIKPLISKRGWGFWAVETTDQKEFIGMVGLHEPSPDLPCAPCVEIGWRLNKHSWGKGYASEAAKACLKYGFEQLNLTEIYSFTSTTNKKSESVMLRLNMVNTGQNFEHPLVPMGSPLREHVLYKLTKKRWSNLSKT